MEKEAMENKIREMEKKREEDARLLKEEEDRQAKV